MLKYITVILLIINAWLIYALFDASIGSDNCRTQNKALTYSMENQLEIIDKSWLGRSRADIEKLTEKLDSKDLILKSSPSKIEINDVVFFIGEDSTIVRVESIGS